MLSTSKSPILTAGVGFLLVILSILTSPKGADGHGFLLEPLARTSLKLRGDSQFSDCPQPPAGYEDTNLNCGGNKTNCAVCGDDINDAAPRSGEELGSLYCGKIAESYTVGSVIDVKVEVTVPHKGFFQFKLCDRDATDVQRMSTSDRERRRCLRQNVLPDANNRTRFRGINQERIYAYELQLPAGVQCDACFLQWRWAGTDNGQEYYGCSDIAITPAK